jgi:outer membrane lipoprotein
MIMTVSRKLFVLLAVLLIAGCATKPRFETTAINTDVTPQMALRNFNAAQGREVLWGGVVVNSSNLADATQIEVLAYPLDDRQRPNTDRSPIGRFLAVNPGYLETADFAPGRLITVRGTVEDQMTGKIGEASYTYPVVEMTDNQLWQREQTADFSRPRVNFGIGVMIGR